MPIRKYAKTYEILGRAKRNRCIVVLMDGTWNDETGKDGDGVVTNVVKLFRCLKPDSDGQIVRYFRGVGNDEENSWWGIKRGGAFGASEKRIRCNAYSTIIKNFHPGDCILIFGFSRGAASARLLASQLEREGIPESITITTEPKQNHYTRHVEERFVSYTSSQEKMHCDAGVEFLGVWDTVGAFGIPVNIAGIPLQNINLFRDMHVSRNVKRAVHLVSIDETRTAFAPTLMNYNADVVEEVWFPGVHSDVGGGYPHDALGRLSLKYMIEMLKAHLNNLNNLNNLQGYNLQFDDAKVKAAIAPSSETHFNFHGLGYKKSLRRIYVQEDDAESDTQLPKIHSSVFDLQDDHSVYSVVRKRRFSRSAADLAHIIYNPINVKSLNGKFKPV